MEIHKGVIQKNGMVLSEGKEYEPDMIFPTPKGLTVLLAMSSWDRYHINEVVGKEVEFVISPKGYPYNFKLVENENEN